MVRETEHLIKCFTCMPGRHDSLIVGDVVEIETFKVCEVHAIVPSRTAPSPCHHVETSSIDQPTADGMTPVVSRFGLNDHNTGKRPLKQTKGQCRPRREVQVLNLLTGASRRQLYPRQFPVSHSDQTTSPFLTAYAEWTRGPDSRDSRKATSPDALFRQFL